MACSDSCFYVGILLLIFYYVYRFNLYSTKRPYWQIFRLHFECIISILLFAQNVSKITKEREQLVMNNEIDGSETISHMQTDTNIKRERIFWENCILRLVYEWYCEESTSLNFKMTTNSWKTQHWHNFCNTHGIKCSLENR